MEYQQGLWLLAPHLMQGLETRYGASAAAAELALCHLQPAGEALWSDVLNWFLHRGIPASLPAEGSAGAATAASDLHLKQCGVMDAWNDSEGQGHIDWGAAQVRSGWWTLASRRTLVLVFRTAPGSTWVARGRSSRTRRSRTGSGGHGTGSGGICSGHDAQAGYFGVAPRVPVVVTRINDCVIIDERAAEFEQAVRYLVDEVQVPIINCSMGTFLRPLAPDPIRLAVDHCYDQGVILVAADGNVPAPNWPAFPAALARSIAVAGVTSEGKRWFLSSYGAWIDLSAPAKEVRRAETREGPAFSYCADSGGTTFAAALTSGAAALWLTRHHVELDRRYKKPWQRVEAFRSMSRQACKVPSTWDPQGGMGSGILHLAGLMDASRLPPAGVLVQR